MSTYQYATCFPADAKVMTKEGFRRIDSIKRGDFILGYVNGEEAFTEVTSWYHHDLESEAKFLEIST